MIATLTTIEPLTPTAPELGTFRITTAQREGSGRVGPGGCRVFDVARVLTIDLPAWAPAGTMRYWNISADTAFKLRTARSALEALYRLAWCVNTGHGIQCLPPITRIIDSFRDSFREQLHGRPLGFKVVKCEECACPTCVMPGERRRCGTCGSN